MTYEQLKDHPRFLELEFTILFEDLVRAFGIESATRWVQSICDIHHINYNLISGVIAKRKEILLLRHQDLPRYRQELLILGLSKGYSKAYIISKIMKVSRQTFYNMHAEFLNPDDFFDADWATQLEFTTSALGVKAYANEVYRFLQIVDILKGLL